MHKALQTAAMLVAVLFAAQSVGGGVVFQDLSVRKALARAETEGKLLLLYYTTTWCAPCRVMEGTTFEDPEVAAWVAEHTVAVKVDGDLSAGRAKRYDERGYPAVVYVDPDGTAVDRIVGLVDTADFLFVGANVLAGNYGTAPARQRAKQTGPRQLNDPVPNFPEIAISRRLEGHVVVRYTITEEGRVRDAEVVESVPPRIFDRSALSTVRRYRFEPVTENGEPVEVTGVRRRISFRHMPR